MQPDNTTPAPQPNTTPELTQTPAAPAAVEPTSAPASVPAAAPVPVPPTKNKRVFKIIAIVGAVFVGIIVIGGIVAYTTTSKTVKTANSFVAAVTAKDFDTAYNFFSPELKQVQSLEQFKSALQSAPFDNSCILKITSRESSAKTGSASTKKLTGNIKCGNASYPTELEFISSDGGEKLLSYNVKPATN